MKITVLGNGSFTIDKNHSGPGYLLQHRGKNILIDCGPGVQSQMAEIGFDPMDLDYIFITHWHNDHVGELIPLLARISVNEYYYDNIFKGNLNIIGPDIKRYVMTVADLTFSGSIKKFSKFEYKEIQEKESFSNFSVESYKVDHDLNLNCFAYRFTVDGKVIVFSGDTNVNQGIIEASKDADLLIVDCGVPKGGKTISHLSSTQVGEICEQNKVKKVVLSHILPPGYDKDLVSEVREIFDGEVILAEKLMTINL